MHFTITAEDCAYKRSALYSNSMIFKNSLSASWLVRELSSPRLDWPRVRLSANCPVSVGKHSISHVKEREWLGIGLALRLGLRLWLALVLSDLGSGDSKANVHRTFNGIPIFHSCYLLTGLLYWTLSKYSRVRKSGMGKTERLLYQYWWCATSAE